jgi:ribosomal protein S18 acetylase RimI-like enzyme
VQLELAPFRAEHGQLVLSWLESPVEARRWASLDAVPDDTGVFDRWHAQPWVHPYVAVADGGVVGYGEVWTDEEEDEAELARLIVGPALRGRGIGRRLAGLLSERAAALGFDQIWLRVAPDNDAAIGCYSSAGFVRATDEQEREFNAGQPQPYVWMRRAG